MLFGTLNKRRMIKIDDLVISSNNENILLIDNGCDISIISNNSFLIEIFTGTFFNVDGTLLRPRLNMYKNTHNFFRRKVG